MNNLKSSAQLCSWVSQCCFSVITVYSNGLWNLLSDTENITGDLLLTGNTTMFTFTFKSNNFMFISACQGIYFMFWIQLIIFLNISFKGDAREKVPILTYCEHDFHFKLISSLMCTLYISNCSELFLNCLISLCKIIQLFINWFAVMTY